MREWVDYMRSNTDKCTTSKFVTSAECYTDVFNHSTISEAP